MVYTTPPTFTAGSILTAAQLNSYLRDNFKALGDAWTSFTPTMTNGTLGNGTLAGAYVQVGKLVFWRTRFILGSTSAITGQLQFNLPATPVDTAARWAIGQFGMDDSSDATATGRRIWPAVVIAGAARVTPLAGETGTQISGTAPWTWATGDSIRGLGFFEAA